MSRESANRLRRSAHGAAFARNDRLLTFLLRQLKPERYAPDATGIAAASSEIL